jgi:ABC-type glutathione transport system ATPase component
MPPPSTQILSEEISEEEILKKIEKLDSFSIFLSQMLEKRKIEKQIEEKKLKYSGNEFFDLLLSTKKEKEDRETRISRALTLSSLHQRREELLSQRKNLEEMGNSITRLKKLSKKVREAEEYALSSMINTINISLRTICSSLFSSEIFLELKLSKKFKTVDKVKRCIYISIFLNGNEIDFSCLSGGEGDRISFALILVLNSLLPSPFLLLDECLSSLSNDSRRECLEILKTIPSLSSKSIMCIHHDDIEGYYDSTISLSSST